jgi:hypothetical protein
LSKSLRKFELVPPFSPDPSSTAVIGAGLRLLATNQLLASGKSIVRRKDPNDLDDYVVFEAYTTGSVRPKFKLRLYSIARHKFRTIAPSKIIATDRECSIDTAKKMERLLEETISTDGLRLVDSPDDSDIDEPVRKKSTASAPSKSNPSTSARRKLP